MIEKRKTKKVWIIRRYKSAEDYQSGKAFDISAFEGNLMLNEGIAAQAALLIGDAATPYSNANTYLGVGDGTVAEDATQTGLQGVNKSYAPMDSGYPIISGQTITWQAVFDENTANHAWEEFTIVNSADDTGTNLNRKVSSQGTKASGQVWTLSLSITLS